VKGQVVAERYELLGILGSGIETTVYRARDFLSGDEVALKVFRAIAVRNPGSLKAFCRDLTILRDDAPPNVVRIFDFERAGEAFYVAMELVRGAPTCSESGGESRWSQAALLDFLEQLAVALTWLHTRGVVHGDIRPSNLVWDGGAIKLMDFGPQRDLRQVTIETPDSCCPYASPERLLGRPLTAASDLYSVGAVVYEFLTGEPPNAEMGMLERAIADAPDVRARAPGVSQELARLVENCLHPDPARRPGDAESIARECRALRGDRPSSEPRLPGKSLAERIGAEPADVGEISTLLLHICGALRGIHEGGLAHPDLAPQNIRLTEDGRASIESFPAPPPNATLRMTEPKYAAPEMLLSQAATDETTHLATDIYVLGLVAYEALAGREAFRKQVFPGGEPESDLFWMKWHADRTARLQPLSEISAGINPELSKLIERMMEKDPGARISSLGAVESGLEQLRRRMRSTEDVELAPAPGAAPRVKSRRALSRMLLVIATIAAAAAWCFSEDAGRRIPVLNRCRRSAEQTLAWVRGQVAGLPHRPAAAAPALPARIELAGGPMVLVPAGRFVFGSSAILNESPARTMYLSAFYIDQYEVTNERYRAFTDSTGYPQPSAPSWDPDYFAKSAHPVLNVSWRDAQAFCVAVGKRLPTEAEWEKAARGASPQSRSWANWTVEGLSNLKQAGRSEPAPVGTFPADVSPFGAYDMAGNVHEWVNDRYGLYSGNPAPLELPDAAKVVRGGSFALLPAGLSPSWRASLDPVVSPGSDSPVGFRCAADASAISHPGTQSQR
jgi:serine/threonine protein kinase/formylglycine-generating enzyme required for sulfatase activity